MTPENPARKTLNLEAKCTLTALPPPPPPIHPPTPLKKKKKSPPRLSMREIPVLPENPRPTHARPVSRPETNQEAYPNRITKKKEKGK